jgi:hypothetical protein
MFVRAVVALGLVPLLAIPALADEGVCHVVDVQLQPQKRTDLRPGKQLPPQIVIWVEDGGGNYIDTVFITQQTGTYGLGNRPGRFDFNSAPSWPYGRRTTTFPVWAERKPERFDSIVFNNDQESNLSHPVMQSSDEHHFCRPMMPEEPGYDAMTCATPNVDTEKGTREPTLPSKYPPRQDMTRDPLHDDPSVDTFRDMNPYDAISAATPAPGQLARIGWSPPFDLPDGDYVMWVEASTEFDHNETYSPTAYPAPTAIPWMEFGEPYRGQPSIVYRVPFTVDAAEHTVITANYAGYGDPTGDDGNVRPPDPTITTNILGSGENRLALVVDPIGNYRVRVTSRHELDFVAPNDPAELAVIALTGRSATFSFVAPGDDAVMGTVRGYEVRYRVGGEPVTAANWDASDTVVVPASIVPVAAGGVQELELSGLLPQTNYAVGIRAYDDCHNQSAISTLAFVTPERSVGEVDACFIATAAYGSALAADVQMLRNVRDSVLRKTVLGELAVQAYYTFGPPVAGVIGESELLRWTAREALVPLVRFVRPR